MQRTPPPVQHLQGSSAFTTSSRLPVVFIELQLKAHIQCRVFKPQDLMCLHYASVFHLLAGAHNVRCATLAFLVFHSFFSSAQYFSCGLSAPQTLSRCSALVSDAHSGFSIQWPEHLNPPDLLKPLGPPKCPCSQVAVPVGSSLCRHWY